MGPQGVYYGYFFALGLLHLLLIIQFQQGFFLTRYQLPNKSSCEDPPVLYLNNLTNLSEVTYVNRSSRNFSSNCNYWDESFLDESGELHMISRSDETRKVIILLIDALRFDFTLRMESIVKTIEKQDSQPLKTAKLLRFYADAPTTTMQRLKALTTGTLPTFMDVRSNFDSSAISEDNLVEQFNISGKKFLMMGDDTWLNLFPSSIYRAYPYPSFNVKDLDTVDNGCKRHLFDTIQRRNEWDVIVSHFLGLDHAGHRFFASHKEADRKIKEMDLVIQDVLDLIKDDPTVQLLVFGDHGMTEDGNHGGTSPEETNAGLFVFSAGGLNNADGERTMIDQVDIVPTISFLLNIPIPFCSLGMIAPEILPSMSDERLVSLLRVNYLQVVRYLKMYSILSPSPLDDEAQASFESDYYYSERSYSISRQKFQKHSSGESHRLDEHDLQQSKQMSKTFQQQMKRIGKACREKWTTFDVEVMTFSIVAQLFCVLVMAFTAPFLFRESFDRHFFKIPVLWISFSASMNGLAIGSAIGLILVVYFNRMFLWIPTLGLLLAVFLNIMYNLPNPVHLISRTLRSLIRFESLIAVLMVTFYVQGLFTNSFIITEFDSLHFLCMSLLLLMVLHNLKYRQAKYSFLALSVSTFMLWVIGDGKNFGPENLLPSQYFEPMQLMLSNVSIVVISFLIRSILGKASIVSQVVAAHGGIICLYWNIQFISQLSKSTMKKFVQLMLARLLLLGPVILISLIVYNVGLHNWNFFLKPTQVNIPHHTRNKPLVFLLIGRNLTFSIIASLSPVMCILHGPKFPFLLVCAMIISISFTKASTLYFSSNLSSSRDKKRNIGGSIPLSYYGDIYPIVLQWLFWLMFFFASGHECSFSKLQISSAYVGFEGFSYCRSGLMLAMNTFAGQIFCVLFSGYISIDTILRKSVQAEKMKLTPVSQLPLSEVFGLSVKPAMIHLFLYSLKVTLTSVNAYRNRRHLMVWEIFAPKFIFDASMFLAAFVMYLFVVGLLFFVQRALSKSKTKD